MSNFIEFELPTELKKVSINNHQYCFADANAKIARSITKFHDFCRFFFHGHCLLSSHQSRINR